MKNIGKNIKFSFINYFIVNILKFIVRMAFVYNLSIEYLGINGLFTNILAMLSLAELGVGPAIIYSLYKPLAVSDKETIKSLMNVFKKVYIAIGIIILIAGLLLYPWIDYFIKDNHGIDELHYFYLIFLFNTAVSYFWSYKRNLLIADQKQYFVNIYQTVIQIIISALQIILLFILSTYWVFVILMLLGTIIENIYIARKADKEYSYLTERAKPLDKKIQKEIIKNTKAMVMHKIGGMVVFSSSNIIISKFVGLAAVGLYSNYFMVIAAMNTFAGKFFESITASIGNMMAIDDKEKKEQSFKIIEFITAFQASLISVGLYVLFNSFIELWLGEKYLFDEYIVSAMVFYFYLTYMRKAVLMFRDACGLFWYDRYKPVAEACINFTLSIYLAIDFGVVGVIYGGIISTLFTCFWVEPYILFKYGLKLSLKKYFKEYIKYTVLTVLIALFIKKMYITIFVSHSVINFILGVLIVVAVDIIIWLIVFRNKEEFLIVKKMVYLKINGK